MIKSIGCFTTPSGIETWEHYVQKFEMMAERHHIPQCRWSEVIPDMLKGGAMMYLDKEMECLQRNIQFHKDDPNWSECAPWRPPRSSFP